MTKTPIFNAALEPLRQALPATLAAALGRIVSRHAYLEWVLGEVLYSLLEISIKQGRAVVRRPGPREYAAAVEGLYRFHKLESSYSFERLARDLERADGALDSATRSVFMRDADRRDSPIYMVRGSWAPGLDLDAVSQGRWPGTPIANAALTGEMREAVEDAIGRAEKLRETTERLLRRMHAARRTNPKLNRRQR